MQQNKYMQFCLEVSYDAWFKKKKKTASFICPIVENKSDFLQRRFMMLSWKKQHLFFCSISNGKDVIQIQ